MAFRKVETPRSERAVSGRQPAALGLPANVCPICHNPDVPDFVSSIRIDSVNAVILRFGAAAFEVPGLPAKPRELLAGQIPGDSALGGSGFAMIKDVSHLVAGALGAAFASAAN